jgi:hypothetical protein
MPARWILALFLSAVLTRAAECPSIYGIHDHQPAPTEYLSHISAGAGCGWVTATVAVGHNPADTSGEDFPALANQGHTVICRINNGYFPNGAIPLTSDYDNFALRCSNFVANSVGCTIWLIGNESNLPGEWASTGTRFPYVSPQSYATCFRKVYNAIKTVRPDHKVLPQALAPFAGPIGAGTLNGLPHDASPLNWVQYMNQMLTAIKASGPLDGIALHITSRGYAYANIHSSAQVTAAGQPLYFSFYVYKDWVDFGIPRSLYHLPLYATECNGYYYWSGGHPEDAMKHYEPGWMQEIYAEINRYNQSTGTNGKPVFRCVNMYRWCATCDGWNIDGSPYKTQILSDLDAAAAQNYRWPANSGQTRLVPGGSIWKYRDIGDQGTAWRNTNYNDAAWSSGPAQLGYGDGDEATTVGYGGDPNNRYITTYFRKWFQVDDPAAFTNLSLQLQRDDGAIVYLNGTEVFRSNMPNGPIAFNTLATNTVGGNDEMLFYGTFVSPTRLRPGTNLLAVEIHQVATNSSDISFDLELLGLGNARPFVSLTHPIDGAMIGTPTNISIQATATDEDGAIARVEFFAEQYRLGQSTTTPFSVTWTNPLDGDFVLRAVAIDSAGARSISAPVNVTFQPALIRSGATWKYRDAGVNLGTAWKETNYNDSAWASGPSQLGYGDGDEATVVAYGGNANNRYITTYFRHSFLLSDVYTNFLLRLLRDDGAEVAPISWTRDS